MSFTFIKEATLKEVRRLLRQRFGERMYKISDDGIYIRQPGQSWQYFAADYDEAVALVQEYDTTHQQHTAIAI